MKTSVMRSIGEAVSGPPGSASAPAAQRYLGLDVGVETVKLVELVKEGATLHWTRRWRGEHGQKPGPLLVELLREWDWEGVQGAAVSGRLGRQVNLPRVPTQQAQARGYRFFFPHQVGTVVSIGSHGFSVLELHPNGHEVYRENSRCSQGTGNFLRQLVGRFGLSIAEASSACAGVVRSAPLSGRCPVILKTDMTHLANKGENRAAILAGLFDAVCENVFVLIKPGASPDPVSLIGGVSCSGRIQRLFQQYLARHGMHLQTLPEEAALFLEALGSALTASRQAEGIPPLTELLAPPTSAPMAKTPRLAAYLDRVQHPPARPWAVINGEVREVILGLDIGSTGAKAVALLPPTAEVVWEGYRRTAGDPVGAAQALLQDYLQGPAGRGRIAGWGVTGSGREIVGSLLMTCYGAPEVFILNEIAAHAAGALHWDARVDTIFEIGGQDAKYIRLAGGRVIDCAMNEACSAGTGSFIEEQGGRFGGVKDVAEMGREALAARQGICLGQHCSVFMAEVIDAAVAAGEAPPTILAGLYDSIIQNYLNRVKGNRSVGEVVFCQGMPFASDALAAAVVRQTGSQVVVPPNPGTVGALGIALLASRELLWTQAGPLDPARFLGARVEQKESFVCHAKTGCGGAGNHCRIDSLRTIVEGRRQHFNWGGGCALYDRGTRKQKLPDLAPDPFREREALLHEIVRACATDAGRGRVAMSDEFILKGLFPFFATFLHALGFGLVVPPGADQTALKRGIQEANVPFCAPLQLYHGLVSQMAATRPDYLFLPMIRSLPSVPGQPLSVVCPMAQASPDLMRCDLKLNAKVRLLSPVIDLGAENMASAEFLASCERLAQELGGPATGWRAAWEQARTVQERLDEQCLELGRRALVFCAEKGITPVVVVGRSYTIYNTVLNSNVPALLREQGALGIPIDCYPVADAVPVFKDMYWGQGQRILRAAHQIRRTPGLYSVYCSNYSCGPDSFTLHFYAYLMEGKPFAIIETDGHAGDAGTKTRLEAFLHCVALDRSSPADRKAPNEFARIELPEGGFGEIRRRQERILVPWMGPGSLTVAACLRSLGVSAEGLPQPDAAALALGRRYTSGKECLPMCLTLGNLLKRLEAAPRDERFALLMPRTCGPCRFGMYNLLNGLTLERLQWRARVRIWSPRDNNYFAGTPPGWEALVFCGFMAADLLQQARLEVRPVETVPGAAEALFKRWFGELLELLERQGPVVRSAPASLWQLLSTQFFGVASLLRRAAQEFAAVRGPADLPTVLVVGEIYVRCDPFANDFLCEKLEALGLRVRLAPFNEWLEYTSEYNRQAGLTRNWAARLSDWAQSWIRNHCYDLVGQALGWPPFTTVRASLEAAAPYLRSELAGEAVLTVGGPRHEFRAGHIDAVVSVGPLECMPNKIAEAQLFHIAQADGLPSLTLPLNGESVDPEVLERFAFEVHTWCQAGRRGHSAGPSPAAGRTVVVGPR